MEFYFIFFFSNFILFIADTFDLIVHINEKKKLKSRIWNVDGKWRNMQWAAGKPINLRDNREGRIANG